MSVQPRTDPAADSGSGAALSPILECLQEMSLQLRMVVGVLERLETKQLSDMEEIKSVMVSILQRRGSESPAGSLAEGSNSNLPLLSPPLSALPPLPAPAVMGDPNKSKSKPKPENKPEYKPENKRDEAYLNAVTEKRINLFESIQAQQLAHRINLFESIQAQQLAHRRSIGGEPIKITMKDGVIKEGKKWLTSPMDVAIEISIGLAPSCLIAQVNGVLWDMNRPLEGDCTLVLFKFDSDEGRDTFWHSSAHILGEALEREYGCKLCIGPCTTRGEGFYYDGYYGDMTLNEDHFSQIKSQN